ncbi:MAG: hypothetical protein LC099_07410 [Anaerolineales bacterium]|nr:hypothetical protein [Anaerolineales bacterium]
MTLASHRPLKKIIVALLVLTLTLTAHPASGQTGVEAENPQAAVDFGKTIVFTAKLKSPLPIQQATLLFRGVNEQTTRVETLQVAEDGSIHFSYDASQNFFPPFGWVVYWFQVTLSDGKTYASDSYAFQYADNRFPWREISQANVVVHWYAGDDAFGANALDAAGAGMLAMKDFIPLSLSEPIHIYIYSNVQDLNAAMMFGGRNWAGGHAHADLGVALVAVAPGANQFAEMETLIPHELAHIMLYRSLGDKYAKQPAWLVEGVASITELYPNPDYARALEVAAEKRALIPFLDLCAAFPADYGSAFQAYAQSRSFVSYIQDSYGASGLSRLMSAYGDGFDCDLGATKALGVSLRQLDARWRENALGQNQLSAAFRNLLPFVLLLILVLLVPIWGTIDALRFRKKKHAARA